MQAEFTIQNIHTVVRQAWDAFNTHKVWAFDAAMGTGKTTFIHALCDELGVKDAVGSPTFSIINQYQMADGRTLYHLDLYHINDEEEAIQAGIEDVLYSGEYCMVEWPEKVPELIPSDALRVHLETINELKRRISITIPE